ncbi:hypothetical protein PIB30_013093 [Stylosanthes scabra]|uniref:Uncharacterized protein n=1 Tax=Stylosanthes scabra TaxID=79078 RepID=A0ABU6V840_9FABA|nr:hypothetical protein [Stylosanthes scabra]
MGRIHTTRNESVRRVQEIILESQAWREYKVREIFSSDIAEKILRTSLHSRLSNSQVQINSWIRRKLDSQVNSMNEEGGDERHRLRHGAGVMDHERMAKVPRKKGARLHEHREREVKHHLNEHKDRATNRVECDCDD